MGHSWHSNKGSDYVVLFVRIYFFDLESFFFFIPRDISLVGQSWIVNSSKSTSTS